MGNSMSKRSPRMKRNIINIDWEMYKPILVELFIEPRWQMLIEICCLNRVYVLLVSIDFHQKHLILSRHIE